MTPHLETALGRVYRGGAWLAAAGIAGAALLVAQGILVARALGPAGLGVLAILAAVVTVTRLLLSFRMNDVVVRYVAPVADEQPAEAAAWLALAALAEAATALIAWLLLVTIGPGIAGWFVRADLAPLVTVYAIVVPAAVVGETALGVLQVYRRFELVALAQTVERVVALAAVAIVTASDGSLAMFVLATAAGPVAGSMLTTALAWTVAARRVGAPLLAPALSATRGRRAEALRFALATNAAGSLSMATKDADPLFLGWLRTPAEAGLYRLAYNVGSLLFLPVAPLSQTVYPEVARQVAQGGKRHDELRALIAHATRPVALFAALVLALCVVFGRPALAALYGVEFGAAAPALTIVVAGVGLGVVTFWARPVVLAAGGAGFALLATAVAAAVKVGLVVLLVPRHGFVINAWSLTAAYAVGAALLVWRAARATAAAAPAAA